MKTWKVSFQDIRTWILIIFLFQLIFITRPPLEPAHSWRQSLTNMMARNFVQEDAELLLPEVDIAGEHSGVIASEVPIFQYILSWFYRWFGFNHWAGRLLNLIFSLTGIFFFFKTLQLCTGNVRLAFFSAWLMLFSNWFSFSVKSMPDTFSVSLAFMAMYGLTTYLWLNKSSGILVFGILASLSMLSKIPAALVLAPSILFLGHTGIGMRKKLILIFTGILALLPVLYWYGFRVPHLVEIYKFELFFPRSISEGWQEIVLFKWDASDKLLNKGFSSYLLSGLSFVGLFWAFKQKSKKAMGLAICVLPVFVFYAIKTGVVWATHSYYMVPLVPFMAISCGYIWAYSEYFRTKWFTILVLLGALESVASQWNDFFIRDHKRYLLNLESECNVFSNRTGKVVCNGTPNPQLMYFMNRRGWSLDNYELTDPQKMNQIIRHKPKWLILDRHRDGVDAITLQWKPYLHLVYTSENLLAFEIISNPQ